MARKSMSSIRTKIYSSFRGVDFSTDPALVDDARSPWAPNMVADVGGMPEKRPGWRRLVKLPGRINGLFVADFGGIKHLLAHAGTTLYRWYDDGSTVTQLAAGLPDDRSSAAYMNGALWVFTGAKLLKYDGVAALPASNTAHVPLTVISASPSTGKGARNEDINLLTSRQSVSYLADGTTKTYKLPYDLIESVDAVLVDGKACFAGTDYSVDITAGTVEFNVAPSAPEAGAADSVYITFSKTFEGYSDRIDKCRVAISWGVGGAADRLVVSGNPDFPNWDFTCGFNDGTYWPDRGYQVIGTEQTAVIGYRRLGENLAIIKEDNGQDSTIFIRSGTLNEDGEAVFSTKPCISGAGAVSRFGFGNIDDEQLFLSGGGVYAITNDNLTSEKIVQNRSARIDPKLIREDLSEAVSVNFDGKYMIFVGGRVYGLDGKQNKSYPSRADTAYLYECFYWENIPARSVAKLVDTGREVLFFGDTEGYICKLNTDIEGLERFSDNGSPIKAMWTTKSDDDGDPMILKTLLKKGNAVTIKPYSRSGATIFFRTDKDAVEWRAAEGKMDIFDWSDIDFERLTFNSNDAPSEIPFNRKVKNYKRLQIVIVNDAVNEGFGVYEVIKHFVTGNFAKK